MSDSEDSDHRDFEQNLPSLQNNIDRQREKISSLKKKNDECVPIIESLYSQNSNVKLNIKAHVQKSDDIKGILEFYVTKIKSQRETLKVIENDCVKLKEELLNKDKNFMEIITEQEVKLVELQEKFMSFPRLYGSKNLCAEINTMLEKANNIQTEINEIKVKLASLAEAFVSPADENDMNILNGEIANLEKSGKIVDQLTSVKNDLVQEKIKLTNELNQAKAVMNSIEKELL